MLKKIIILLTITLLNSISYATDIEVHNVKVNELSALIQKLTGEKIIHIGKLGSSKFSMSLYDATNVQILELFHETLSGVNLALIKEDDYFKVVNIYKITKHSPPIVETLDNTIGVVTYISKINKKTAVDVIKALTPLLGEGGKILHQATTSSILITDSTKNIKKLISLINIIQDGYQPLEVKQISVDYADVTKIADEINKLGIKDLKVIADRDNNQIFLHGYRNDIKEATKVAEGMNIQKNKVIIEVLIAEISQSGVSSNGVQIGLGTDYGLGLSAWSNTDTVNLASIITGLTTGELPTLQEGASFGVASRSNSGVNFGIIAQAIKRNGKSNILSTPIINTIDGQEAEFIVGKNVPFVTRMDQGDNPFQSVVREDVGLKLKVKPVVMSDGRIRMSVEQEISSISGSTKLDDIITDKRYLKTVTISESGSLVVLGGLMDKSGSDKMDKIPLLGDIPYLGRLFSFKKEDQDKRKLLIFMKPTVVFPKDKGKSARKLIKNQDNLYKNSIKIDSVDAYSYFNSPEFKSSISINEGE